MPANTKHYTRRPCASKNTKSAFPPNMPPTALNLVYHAAMKVCDEYGIRGSEGIHLV